MVSSTGKIWRRIQVPVQSDQLSQSVSLLCLTTIVSKLPNGHGKTVVPRVG